MSVGSFQLRGDVKTALSGEYSVFRDLGHQLVMVCYNSNKHKPHERNEEQKRWVRPIGTAVFGWVVDVVSASCETVEHVAFAIINLLGCLFLKECTLKQAGVCLLAAGVSAIKLVATAIASIIQILWQVKLTKENRDEDGDDIATVGQCVASRLEDESPKFANTFLR